MGLRLLHLNLHGLIRSHDLELGRDSDTGGQTLYVLELVKGLAARPEVDKVQLLTRLIVDRKSLPIIQNQLKPYQIVLKLCVYLLVLSAIFVKNYYGLI